MIHKLDLTNTIERLTRLTFVSLPCLPYRNWYSYVLPVSGNNPSQVTFGDGLCNSGFFSHNLTFQSLWQVEIHLWIHFLVRASIFVVVVACPIARIIRDPKAASNVAVTHVAELQSAAMNVWANPAIQQTRKN
jgi:hypothetical protein